MSDEEENSSSSLDSGQSAGSSPPSPTSKVEKPEKNVGSNGNEDSGSESDHSSRKSHNNSKPSVSRSASSSSDSGSGSSSDSSDHSDEEKDEKSEGNSGDEGRRSRSSRSRSGSRSGSGSGSSRSHSGSDQSDSEKEGQSQGDIKKLWQRDPDFYGIRRSSRNRSSSSNSKPPKLIPQIRTPNTGKRPATKKPVGMKKRKRISSDEDASSDEEQTRCVRKRGTAVVSYKEDDSDDDDNAVSATEDEATQESQNGEPESEEQFETIERIMDIREGKRGATGSGTTIYAVEERGNPLDNLGDEVESETQFFIKWVGWSHLHNTWESLETIQDMKAKGLKKLDNYCKKEDELARWRRHASPEDTEYYECQLELQQELAKAYTKAERIIAEHKTPDGQAEFYVKWECLPYAEATWENGALIRKRNPEVIEIFKRRDSSNRTPTSSKSFRSRPKFSQLKDQPEYMMGDNLNLILRDYQLDGVNWLVHSWCKENSVILADEMGLGKTIQTICYLAYLFETHQLYGPFLIVVPLSTMAAWQKEFGQWAPQINVVTYLGDIQSRDIIREHEWLFKSTRRIKFNAILTTYEIVLKDKAFLGSISWAILMVDEAHRLKNGDSLLYKTLADFDTNHRLLITGTPLQNSLKELWSLLHFIMPKKFDEWESFEQEHDHAATKGYAKLHKQLEPYILRRVKKDVEKSLPSKVEQILRVEMTSLQKQYYKWILTKNYSALRRGVKGSVSSFINVVMELKKCCNHASLVKPIDSSSDSLTTLVKGSGKLMLLDKLLVRLKETGHRVLIFSQMVRMLDIIAEYLQQRRFSFQRLDGSIKGDIRKQALDHFNAEGSTDFCFLLSTRAGGLGINLATADTVIIFDSDWNPQNDLQAQARAHRIGQKNQVNIYRLVTKNSVEEDIVERAKQKMVLDHLVIQRMDTTGRTVLDKGKKSGTPFNKEELTAILKFGAEELFKEEDNDGDDQCDIDEILQRAETHEEAARPGEELLSAFKVASFSVNEDEEDIAQLQGQSNSNDNKDWDQIIPEDIRKKVEDEEREKEMADLYLPPRSSRNAAANEGRESTEASPITKGRRSKRKHDESEDSDSDGGRPKKRGRPTKTQAKERIKGFTDTQIRKFIKSFKRFPKPLLRIESLAKDANLAEKSLTELKKLAETLMERCNAAVEEYKANPALAIKDESASNTPAQSEVDGASTSADGKKKKPPKEKGPSFKLAGVQVNARTLLSSIEEMSPLGEVIPKEDAARKAWKFDLKAKTALYECDWGPEDDTRLLIGVWEHGMGCWEAIRESDPVLKEKIFIEGDKKPQFKHICTRAEYLIKVIKKHLALTQPTVTKERKKRAEKKKDVAEVKAEPGVAIKDESGNATNVDGVQKETKSKVKKPKKKKDPGPMHITVGTEPTPLHVLGELEPRIFNECKEKMRPVKKALKSLDNPDTSRSEKEQVRHTRNCLIQIGDQIQTCLEAYKDPAQVKQWSSHLWSFVSKFTEYEAHKLSKLYRRAVKKDSDSEEKPSKSKEKNKEKSKDKSSKEKKSKREKEPINSFHENSNSSQSDFQTGKAPNSQYRDRDRNRDRNRFAANYNNDDPHHSGNYGRPRFPSYNDNDPHHRPRFPPDAGFGFRPPGLNRGNNMQGSMMRPDFQHNFRGTPPLRGGRVAPTLAPSEHGRPEWNNEAPRRIAPPNDSPKTADLFPPDSKASGDPRERRDRDPSGAVKIAPRNIEFERADFRERGRERDRDDGRERDRDDGRERDRDDKSRRRSDWKRSSVHNHH